MPLIHGQICLHDNHVLRPPNQESLMQNVRCRFIGSEKVPHPAEIPRRKARVVGAFGCKILCCRHSCSFFCSGADQFPDFEIQLHLRQISSKRLIQTSVHCAVINGLSDVHGLLLSGAMRLIPQITAKRNTAYFCRTSLCRDFYITCTICSQSRICLLSIA